MVQVIVEPACGLTAPQKVQQSQVHIHLNCKCGFPHFLENTTILQFLCMLQVIVEPARGLTPPQKVQQSQIHI